MKGILRSVHFLEGENFSLEKGDIVIEKGRIQDLVSCYKGKGDWEVDGEGLLAVPAFVNAHVHLLDALWKDQKVGLSIPELFGRQGWKNRKIQETFEKDLEKGARRALWEMVYKGTLAAFVFVEDGLRGLKILKRAQRGIPIDLVLFGRPKKGLEEKEVQELLTLGDGLGIPSSRAFSLRELETLRKWAKGAPMAIHLAEVSEEKEGVEVLNCLAPQFVVHGNFFSLEELRILKRRSIGLVVCLSSAWSYGIPCVSPSLLLREAIPFALGTDNVMSTPPDVSREMNLFSLWARREEGGKFPFLEEEILASCTWKPWQWIGQNRGKIAPGQKADLLLVRMEPTFSPWSGLKNFLFRFSPVDIVWILKDGILIQRRSVDENPLDMAGFSTSSQLFFKRNFGSSPNL